MKRITNNWKYIFCFILGIILGFTGGRFFKVKEHLLVEYNGKKINEKEIIEPLRRDIEGQTKAIEETKKKFAIEKIKQHLLEDEAKKKNKTTDDLLTEIRNEVEKKEITDEEYKDYIKSQGLEGKAVSRQQKEIYMRVLKNLKIMEAQRKYMDSLVNEKDIQIKIEK